MVGDQLFADIMAGRLAGIRTILVKPMHPRGGALVHAAETLAGAFDPAVAWPFFPKWEI